MLVYGAGRERSRKPCNRAIRRPSAWHALMVVPVDKRREIFSCASVPRKYFVTSPERENENEIPVHVECRIIGYGDIPDHPHRVDTSIWDFLEARGDTEVLVGTNLLRM